MAYNKLMFKRQKIIYKKETKKKQKIRQLKNRPQTGIDRQ